MKHINDKLKDYNFSSNEKVTVYHKALVKQINRPSEYIGIVKYSMDKINALNITDRYFRIRHNSQSYFEKITDKICRRNK